MTGHFFFFLPPELLPLDCRGQCDTIMKKEVAMIYMGFVYILH